MSPEHAIHSPSALIFFGVLFGMTIFLTLLEPLLEAKHWRLLLGGLATTALAGAFATQGNPEVQRISLAAGALLGFFTLVFGKRRKFH